MALQCPYKTLVAINPFTTLLHGQRSVSQFICSLGLLKIGLQCEACDHSIDCPTLPYMCLRQYDFNSRKEKSR